MLNEVFATIDRRRDASVSSLGEFLRIPSVSTKPEHAADVSRCAQWLAERLREAGLEASVRPTGGHPIVLARNAHRPGRPTVLFYGHYDVQPPEPLEKWVSPPFEPVVRDNALFARGAADDKGQVWAHVAALSAWREQGGVPVNIVALIEGEEEIGSENLEAFVRANSEELRADIAVISDTNQFAPGAPAITVGLRGLVYFEVKITAADHDLHSGIYGGAVPNPANILCQLIGTLHDAEGRVNLPGFYDDVVPIEPAQAEAWRQLPFSESNFLKGLKLTEACGEKGFSTLERRWARPTCDVNGLTGGYQGHGAKTVIPSTASAKISMRLVADQKPERIADAFETAMRERCPAAVKIEFTRHGLAGPVLMRSDGRAIQLASEAVALGFGAAPTLIREGGSIPVVGLFQSVLGIDTLLVGFGLPDDRVHSPNEKFDLDSLHAGMRTAAALYDRLALLRTY